MNIGASYGEIKIFTCNANEPLASKIVERLANIGECSETNTTKANLKDLKLSKARVGKFKDGEISLKIDEGVRECDVFIIQSTSNPVNDNLMELLLMIDACKRASAKRITAVIPYYGYARQDRKVRARDPISAKLVSNLLTSAGAHRILTMDLHSTQIQGFFDIPLDNLLGIPIFNKYYTNKIKDLSKTIIVSPDLGSVGRSRTLAENLHVNLAIVDKRRPRDNVAEVVNVIGGVRGKTAILMDDEIDTAGSITNAAQALVENGAEEIYACCTHGKFSDNALQKIKASPIKELLTLDTIKPTSETLNVPNIKVLSVSEIFARAIFRIHEGISVSDLFH